MKKIDRFDATVKGENNRTMGIDLTVPVSKTAVPVVVFCHGFKGFKDWGHFNWVAQSFAEQGLAFLKFNFSHNGVVMDSPTEITDLEAFSNNNYSIELKDLNTIIDFVYENAEKYNLNPHDLSLIGHSRGGGIALLKGAEDKRVAKIALWASLSEFDSFFWPETIKEWEANGVVYAENKRTGQKLPLKKQFYDDYQKNKASLDIRKAAKMLDKPLLIVHGDKDESVHIQHAETLYNLVQHSIFIRVEDGDHTFGAKHPFNAETDVTPMLEELVENTVEFFLD